MKNILLTCLLLLSLPAMSVVMAQENWVRQNPDFEPVDLHDVSMLADGTGLATGSKGTAWYTTDFGTNWLLRPQVSFSTLTQAAVVPNGSTTILLTAGLNAFYKSINAGQSWQTYLTQPAIGTPNYLKGFGPNTYLLGGPTGLRRTTDGGDTWTDMSVANSPVPMIASYDFINATTGWAASTVGDVYKTTNGGSSWTLINSNYSSGLILAFHDNQLGYAGYSTDLLKTTDGGVNWTTVLPSAFGSNIEDIAIIDPQTVVFSQGNRVFRTDDGGVTATKIFPNPYSSRNRGVTVLPDGRVWVASSYMQIAYSADAGLTYIDQLPGQKNFLGFVDFLDMQNGIAGGNGGALLRTNNGGNDWMDISFPEGPDGTIVNDGVVVAANEYYALVNKTVVHTTNGGTTWTVQYETPTNLASLDVKGSLILVADNGSNIHRSTNGGTSWTQTSIATFTPLTDLTVVTDQIAYVAGWDGFVAKTTNAGLSWTTLTTPNEERYASIYFRTPTEGWITYDTFSPDLLYTSDGGATWTVRAAPATSLWRTIWFIDENTGYISGGSSGSGIVYRTDDGGTSWQSIHNTSQSAYAMAGQATGDQISLWIVGTGGNIENGLLIPSSTSQQPVQLLEVYPNPVTEVLHIQLPTGLSARAQLQVYTSTGQYIATYPAADWLDLQALPAATYELLLIDGTERYGVRVVKVR